MRDNNGKLFYVVPMVLSLTFLLRGVASAQAPSPTPPQKTLPDKPTINSGHEGKRETVGDKGAIMSKPDKPNKPDKPPKPDKPQ